MRDVKRRVLILVASAALGVGVLSAGTVFADQPALDQPTAQDLLTTFGDAGLLAAGLSPDQVAVIKRVAAGQAIPTTETMPPASGTPQTPGTPPSGLDPATAKDLLSVFGEDGLLAQGLTLDQIAAIKQATKS